MIKHILVLFFVAVFLSQGAEAQVRITEEPEVSRMMSDFVYRNQQKKEIKGWRIQIITTNDRRRSEAAKARFEQLYNDIPARWEQEVPFYKVKVGAYETKEELQAFLLEIKNDFPSAIPVVDQVSIDELAF